MTLMVRIAPDMRLLVLPPPISSYSPKFGSNFVSSQRNHRAPKRKKKEKKLTKHTTIYTDKNTQINKNRLNTLKTGSPVESPFFCSGENLTSKPWDRLESIFRLKSPPRIIFSKEKGKERKTQSFVFKTRKRTQVRVLII